MYRTYGTGLHLFTCKNKITIELLIIRHISLNRSFFQVN
jgi:hypothetical protein